MANSASSSEDCQARPSRAASCQLPLPPPGPSRNLHRQSQSCSCEAESAKLCEAGLLSQRSGSCRLEYDGGKSEKHRPAGSALASLALLAVVTIMIPIAFIGGFGVAAIIGKAGSCQGALQPIRVPIRFTKATGDGRQLTSADNMLLPGMDGKASKQTGRQETAVTLPALPGADMLFVTWIAFGDFGDGGFHTHNFHQVDMRWAEVARKSHPGCKIGLVLDQDTQLDDPASADFLYRLEINKTVYGRNEYNDLYHWTARRTMLQQLQAANEDRYNVVFVDPDVFVLDDLRGVFDHYGFDYMTTISENPVQPINGAMHFVRAHRYGGALDVLSGVLNSFQLKPEMGFTAGQQAYSDYFELTLREELVKELQHTAVEDGVACHRIQGGEFKICFVTCARYNYWEKCTDHPDMDIAVNKAAEYARIQVKVLHFIAYRKLGMSEVYDAFMGGGLHAAYAAWAELPHTEDSFKADKRFAKEAW